MSTADLKFIEILKTRMHRCVTPDTLPKITPTHLSDLGSFITFLVSYDISRCFQTYVKLDESISVNRVFSALSRCWVSDLRYVINLAHASSALRKFIDLYLSKFEISEFINALRERESIDKGHYYFLKAEVLDKVGYVRNVNDLINALKDVRRPWSRLFNYVLPKYSNTSLGDLNVSTVEELVYDRFWRDLMIAGRKLHPKIKLTSCLRLIQMISKLEREVRRTVISNEDLSSTLRKVPAVISNAIEAAETSVQELDTVFGAIRYMYCINELKFSPLSYDIVLNYLLIKEWESFLISFITYLMARGFDKEYILERVGRWWKVYGYLVKSK